MVKFWMIYCLIGLGMMVVLLLSGGRIRDDLSKDWAENKVRAVKNFVILVLFVPGFTVYILLESLVKALKK